MLSVELSLELEHLSRRCRRVIDVVDDCVSCRGLAAPDPSWSLRVSTNHIESSRFDSETREEKIQLVHGWGTEWVPDQCQNRLNAEAARR